LSWGAVLVDQTAPLTTAAKFARFAAENRKSLTLIKKRFVTDYPLALIPVVGAADATGNGSGIFV
jgi:hypothetical protein